MTNTTTTPAEAIRAAAEDVMRRHGPDPDNYMHCKEGDHWPCDPHQQAQAVLALVEMLENTQDWLHDCATDESAGWSVMYGFGDMKERVTEVLATVAAQLGADGER